MSGNLSCGVAPVTDVGPVCGGHGTCVVEAALGLAVCLCEPYWQGESDFQVTTSLVDCQINVILIQVLWAIFLAFHVIYIAAIARPKLQYLWRKHQSLVQKYKASGKHYPIRENKGLFALLPIVTVGWLAQFCMAIVKIADQNHKIGNSVLVTVLYILWRTTFIICPDTFQPALLASLLRSERNLDHIIELNRKLSLAHMFFFMSLSILTIIPMVVAQDPFLPIVGMTSMATFCNLASLCMFFLAAQAVYIEKRVNKVLLTSYAISKEARTAKVMTKIATNQRDTIKGGMVQFLVYAFFGCFPYMWNKHDYLVPFSFIAADIQINRVMTSLIQEEDDKGSRVVDQQVIVVNGDLKSSSFGEVGADKEQLQGDAAVAASGGTSGATQSKADSGAS